MAYWRHLKSQFFFWFGLLWAGMGAPLILLALHLAPQDGWKSEITLGGMGLTFGCLGWALILIAARRTLSAISLLRRGVPVVGKVTDVVVDRSVEINGRNPWFLRYTFTGPDGKVYDCRSEDLPRGFKSRFPEGSEITVICDPTNPAEHFADVLDLRALL